MRAVSWRCWGGWARRVGEEGSFAGKIEWKQAILCRAAFTKKKYHRSCLFWTLTKLDFEKSAEVK